MSRKEWLAAELAGTRWGTGLTTAERTEMVATSDTLRRAGVTLESISSQEFSLTRLAATADAVRDRLAEFGVALLRGFPIADLADLAPMAFWGFAALIGTPVPQNRDGQRIDVVRNENTATVRGAKTNRELIFHTDFASSAPDAFGLLVVRPARQGGESLLVDGLAVRRILATEFPDVAETLCGEFCFDRTGDVAPGQSNVVWSPVIQAEGVRYNRARIHRGHRVAGIPLTDAQVHALDVLDDVLRRPDLVYRTTLSAGDALFIDNTSVLHSRTAFTDWPEPGQGRQLLRVWLDGWRDAS